MEANNNQNYIPPTPEHHYNTWKIVIAGIIVITLAFAGWFYFTFIKNPEKQEVAPQIPLTESQTNKIAEIPALNLDLTLIQVPDSQNAFSILNTITSDEIKDTITKASQLDYVEGKSFDENNAIKIINANKTALDKFDKAVQQTYFQIPYYSDPKLITLDSPLYPINNWRNVNNIYLIKAITLAKQGKTDEALTIAFKSLKLGHNIQQSQGGIILYIVGTTMKDRSLEAIQTILPLVKSADTLKVFNSSLDQYKDNKIGLVNALKYEYNNALLALKSISLDIKTYLNKQINDPSISPQEKEILSYALNNPNKAFSEIETKKYNTDYFINQINAVNQDCSNLKEIQIPNLLPRDQSEYINTNNIIGKLLFQVATVNYFTVFQKACEQNVLFNAVKNLASQTKF